jgi:hypothetical protein
METKEDNTSQSRENTVHPMEEPLRGRSMLQKVKEELRRKFRNLEVK